MIGDNEMKPRFLRSLLPVAVLACVAAAATVGTEALATPHDSHHPTKTLTVFTHASRTARARLAAVAPPPGAVLATVVGDTEVFADQNENGEDCVIYLRPSEGGGSACDAAAHVEQYGEVLIRTGKITVTGAMPKVTVAALVPNGVTSLTFTDRSGKSYTVAVKNNAAEREDNQVASVAYTAPNGSTQTTNVAALVNQIRQQTGPNG